MPTADPSTFLLDRKWPFRIAVGLWLAIGVAAWFAADHLDRPAQVVVAGLWVVGLGLLLRQFLRSLFGPVLAFDALRVGRKRRQFWFRTGYAVFLSIAFLWVYFAWLTFGSHTAGERVPPKVLSGLAETYFSIFMVVQFILVCVLTPASVAGAVADEKERRTLEFLLATDLRDREILFGKLASRVGSLLLFLLTGLPILGLLQFFGGIDPDLVIAGFAATFATVLSLAAVSMAASVLARRARDAIALTYLLAALYVVGSFAIYALGSAPPFRWAVEIWGYSVRSEEVAYPAVAGNPFFMVPNVLARRAFASVDLFSALWHYLLFHAVVIAVLVTWAGLRLRPIALRQAFGGGPSLLNRLRRGRRPARGGPTRPGRRAFRSRRPVVGDQPVLWKEVFVDTGLKLGGFGKAFVIGLVGLSFVPVGFIFWFSIVEPSSWRGAGAYWWSATRWDEFGEEMNGYLRSAGTVATCLVWLATAIRGAGVISGERDRHTLDALLTTPLSARTIVWGKWWGCLLGMRWAWAWILSLWVVTLAAGGVHPVMFVPAAASIAVYGGAFAWIGIFCSLHLRTTLQATMAAILLSLFLAGGYFLVFAFCCVLPMEFAGTPAGDLKVPVSFLCGLSPPVCVAWLPVHEFDTWELNFIHRDLPFVPFWVLGLVVWGAMSLVLSQKSVSRFRRMANRLPGPPPSPIRRGPPPLPKRRPEPSAG